MSLKPTSPLVKVLGLPFRPSAPYPMEIRVRVQVHGTWYMIHTYGVQQRIKSRRESVLRGLAPTYYVQCTLWDGTGRVILCVLGV